MVFIGNFKNSIYRNFEGCDVIIHYKVQVEIQDLHGTTVKYTINVNYKILRH